MAGLELPGRRHPPVGRGQRAEDPLGGERPDGRVDGHLQPVRAEDRLGVARGQDQHVLHGDRAERAGKTEPFFGQGLEFCCAKNDGDSYPPRFCIGLTLIFIILNEG